MITFRYYFYGIIAGTIAVFYPAINPYIEGFILFNLAMSVISYIGEPLLLGDVMISDFGRERIRARIGESMLSTVLAAIAGILVLLYQDVYNIIFIAVGVIETFLVHAYVSVLSEYLPEE